MGRVAIPLADGFEDIEALSVVDVLRRGGVEVVTAALGASTAVRSAHGVTVSADTLLKDVADEAFDAVVLPGGGEGTENLRSSEPVLDLLRRQAEGQRLVCAICAAPTVLVAAGVVPPETHLTCYPSCAPDLDRPCEGVPVVEDGLFVTGQAPGSALLFALVVLKKLRGEEVARRVAAGMVTDVFG